MDEYESKIQVYDPVAKTWDTSLSFPSGYSGGAGLCTAVAGNYIYVGGGAAASNDYTTSKLWYRYDPENNKWERMTDMITGLHDASCGSDEVHVAAFGGSKGKFGDGVGTRLRLLYNIELNTWESGYIWTWDRLNGGAASLVDINKLYFGGGENMGETLAAPNAWTWNNITWKYVIRDGEKYARTGWWPVAIATNMVFHFGGSETPGGEASTTAGMVVYEPIGPFYASEVSTPAPTASSTKSPTWAPTNMDDGSPTSAAPTKAPTSSPTNAPTGAPTDSPAVATTESPADSEAGGTSTPTSSSSPDFDDNSTTDAGNYGSSVPDDSSVVDDSSVTDNSSVADDSSVPADSSVEDDSSAASDESSVPDMEEGSQGSADGSKGLDDPTAEGGSADIEATQSSGSLSIGLTLAAITILAAIMV